MLPTRIIFIGLRIIVGEIDAIRRTRIEFRRTERKRRIPPNKKQSLAQSLDSLTRQKPPIHLENLKPHRPIHQIRLLPCVIGEVEEDAAREHEPWRGVLGT